MKLLLVPDIHLGKSSNLGKEDLNGNNSRIEDQKNLLYFVLDQAKKNSVDRIVLTGDIFDHYNPKPNLVVLFMEWMSNCINYCPVDIVLGNHEFTRTDKNKTTILDCITAINLSNCNVIKEPSQLKLNSLAITYLPYTDRRQLNKQTIQEAITEIQSFIKPMKNCKNIAIGHLSLEGSFYVGDEIEDDINEIFIPLSTFSDYDAVFMGHVHKYQTLSEKPLIMHVGSLEKTSFNDGDKYIVIYDSKTNDIKPIQVPCRKLIEINIKIPDDVDETDYVLKQMESLELEDSIVRIKVESNSIDSEIDKKTILKKISEKNIHNLCSFTETKRNNNKISKNDELNETIDHNKAIDMAVKLIKADQSFINDVTIACKDIINLIKENK